MSNPAQTAFVHITQGEQQHVFSTALGNLLSFKHEIGFSKSLSSKYVLEIIDPEHIFEKSFLQQHINATSQLSQAMAIGANPFYIQYGYDSVEDGLVSVGPNAGFPIDIKYDYSADGLRKLVLTLGPSPINHLLDKKDQLGDGTYQVQGSAPIFGAPISGGDSESPVSAEDLIWPGKIRKAHHVIRDSITDYIRDNLLATGEGENVIVCLPNLDTLLFDHKVNTVSGLENSFDWARSTQVTKQREIYDRSLLPPYRGRGTGVFIKHGSISNDDVREQKETLDDFYANPTEEALSNMKEHIAGFNLTYAEQFYPSLGFSFSWQGNPFRKLEDGQDPLDFGVGAFWENERAVNLYMDDPSYTDPDKPKTREQYFNIGLFPPDEKILLSQPLFEQEKGATPTEHSFLEYYDKHPFVSIKKYGKTTAGLEELSKFINEGIGSKVNSNIYPEFEMSELLVLDSVQSKDLIEAIEAKNLTKLLKINNKVDTVKIFGDARMISTFFSPNSLYSPWEEGSKFFAEGDHFHTFLQGGGAQGITTGNTSKPINSARDSFLLNNTDIPPSETEHIFHSGKVANSNILSINLNINMQYLVSLIKGAEVARRAVQKRDFTSNASDRQHSSIGISIADARGRTAAAQKKKYPKFNSVYEGYSLPGALVDTAKKVLDSVCEGSIKTLPYFKINNSLDLVRTSVLLLISEPKVAGLVQNLGVFNSIFTGKYLISGFRHTITPSEVVSEFKVARLPVESENMHGGGQAGGGGGGGIGGPSGDKRNTDLIRRIREGLNRKPEYKPLLELLLGPEPEVDRPSTRPTPSQTTGPISQESELPEYINIIEDPNLPYGLQQDKYFDEFGAEREPYPFEKGYVDPDAPPVRQLSDPSWFDDDYNTLSPVAPSWFDDDYNTPNTGGSFLPVDLTEDPDPLFNNHPDE